MDVSDVAPEQQVKLPHGGDDSALTKQVTFTANELVEESDLYGQTEKSPSILVSRSDILSLLHRKLGVQSISDHHSYWFTWDAQVPQTVKELLDRLPELIARSAKKDLEAGRRVPEDPKSDPMWGWDGTCVQMRERLPYKLDADEPPNRLIRRLRASLAQNRYVDFDVVAEMAALTSDQSGTLTRNWDRLIKQRGTDYGSGDLILYALLPTVSSPAMKLYAHLTDAQKRAVRADGLQATALMPSQFDDLEKCVTLLPAEQPKEGSQARRVGIYKSDTRLDKPEPGSIMSAMIRLAQQANQIYTCMVPLTQIGPNDRWRLLGPKAQSSEDAWQQCLRECPDLAKRQRFFGKDMGYAMLFTFADGTTKERPIEIYAPVTVGR